MDITNLLAGFFGDFPWWILICLAPFATGGIAILVKHQQRMAEIVHGMRGQGSNQEMAGMQDQINQLRQQVAQLTLALDEVKRLPATSEVRQRITEVES